MLYIDSVQRIVSGELSDDSFPGLQFIVEFLAKLVF